MYSGFILNNFSKWRGNTSFYLTLFSVTLSRAKHLGAAGSHSFEQFPAVKCASKLKSHEHIQNTCPHHFWYGFPCLFYRYKSGPQSWFGRKHFFKFVKCKNNKIVYLTCRRKNNLNGMRSGHLKNSCFQATIIFSFLILYNKYENIYGLAWLNRVYVFVIRAFGCLMVWGIVVLLNIINEYENYLYFLNFDFGSK